MTNNHNWNRRLLKIKTWKVSREDTTSACKDFQNITDIEAAVYTLMKQLILNISPYQLELDRAHRALTAPRPDTMFYLFFSIFLFYVF